MTANGKRSASPHFSAEDLTLAEALRRKECAIMRRRELEADVMAGKLVNADDIENCIRSSYALVRQRLMQIPAKLAVRLAHLTSAAKCAALMEKEFISALNHLSDEAGERLKESEAKNA